MNQTIRYIDLFCGIGGFRIAANNALDTLGLVGECVFSSDIDEDARRAYEANFGDRPFGDITSVTASEIPDHDLLLAGFPCQAFSIMGDMKGFEDTRGTLFFEVARIIEAKLPALVVLENVRQLVTHDRGHTIKRIMETLAALGYTAQYRVLDARDFGLPQKRERVLIVATRDCLEVGWPSAQGPHRSLESFLESDVPEFYWASERIQRARLAAVSGKDVPDGRTIWHENKSGNVSPLPYSCALRAGASYNYLLVDGQRRLTEREMLRLQGFPDSYKVVCGYSATRKQAGNSVPIPMIEVVIRNLLEQWLVARSGSVFTCAGVAS